MNNAVFGKTMKNVENSDIKLGVRAKLPHYKAFYIRFISKRNEKKNRNTYE